MNIKLLLAAVITLFAVSAAEAYEWTVVNHTDYSIKARFKMAGKDHEETINKNSSYKHSSGATLGQGVEIKGVKSLLGDNYFGGSSSVVLLKDEFSGKGFGTTWHVFQEQKVESSIHGTTVSFTPAAVRFLLVRQSFGTQGGGVLSSKDGRIGTTGWYNISGTSAK